MYHIQKNIISGSIHGYELAVQQLLVLYVVLIQSRIRGLIGNNMRLEVLMEIINYLNLNYTGTFISLIKIGDSG